MCGWWIFCLAAQHARTVRLDEKPIRKPLFTQYSHVVHLLFMLPLYNTRNSSISKQDRFEYSRRMRFQSSYISTRLEQSNRGVLTAWSVVAALPRISANTPFANRLR